VLQAHAFKLADGTWASLMREIHECLRGVELAQKRNMTPDFDAVGLHLQTVHKSSLQHASVCRASSARCLFLPTSIYLQFLARYAYNYALKPCALALVTLRHLHTGNATHDFVHGICQCTVYGICQYMDIRQVPVHHEFTLAAPCCLDELGLGIKHLQEKVLLSAGGTSPRHWKATFR
jgi:hypothetical protein